MIPLMIGIVFVLWLVLNDVLDLLGYKAQPNLDVYDRWVDLELTRRYEGRHYVPSHKGVA